MNARTRLIAFQFAGANRHAYRCIQRELGRHIELCCFELPGRGRRHAEPPLTDLRSMVADLIGPISERVAGVQYALFGHSMGAQLARLAGGLLLERGARSPLCLVVSASAAPGRHIVKERHRLAPADLLQELRTLGGCPEEVLNDAELVDLFLPVLRADFQALETYQAEARAPLPCPITVLRGLDDREVSKSDAEAWRAETTGGFEVHDFPGGHFFPIQNPRPVAALLDRLLERAVDKPAPPD
jgi:medium-chain acyl-[acyl-carrier-protein] hydrolase